MFGVSRWLVKIVEKQVFEVVAVPGERHGAGSKRGLGLETCWGQVSLQDRGLVLFHLLLRLVLLRRVRLSPPFPLHQPLHVLEHLPILDQELRILHQIPRKPADILIRLLNLHPPSSLIDSDPLLCRLDHHLGP